jgi:tRNA (guanine-N7-)-methyltransferase
MSFGLSHGRELSDAGVGIDRATIPPLPDNVLTNPAGGWLDLAPWFAAPAQPLEIEVGSGKGSFLLNQAAAEPGTNFLGIEYAREFYLYASDRVRRRGLANVRTLCIDASEFLRWRVPSACARVIHLYYSDPWPKRRHHKNRLVQHEFLATCFRVLGPGGELRVVTDHDELWDWDMAHFQAWTDPAGLSAQAVPGIPPISAQVVDAVAAARGDARTEAPFAIGPFVPPVWVGEGQTIATNYEKKMCEAVGKKPHACVLKRT